MKDEIAEYHRRYYQIHKEKAKEYNRQYRQTHKEKAKEYGAQYYQAHKSEMVEYRKIYGQNHKLEARERCRKYAQTHKVEEVKRHHQYHILLKAEVLTHYGNGKLACVRCSFGDIRALSIDHINGGGHKHKIELVRGRNIYNWLKNNNYPEGYQTLCGNCQWIKRVENKEFSNHK
jgi:hypothetical protein